MKQTYQNQDELSIVQDITLQGVKLLLVSNRLFHLDFKVGALVWIIISSLNLT